MGGLRALLSAIAVVAMAMATVPPAMAQDPPAEPAPVADEALTVDGPALFKEPEPFGPQGIDEVTVDQLDVGLLNLFDGPAAAPLRASPLRASPLRASPLRASPLRASPLRASPLRASPLRASPLRASPLRASSLPPMPLSTVPLINGLTWGEVLVGTPYEGLPLQAVTLQQVLALEGYDAIDGLSIEDIALDSTPLRASSIQAFLLAGPTLEDLSSSTDWCAVLDCGLVNPATDTLLDAELAGVPAAVLGFVGDLPISGADLSGAIIADYDVGSVQVDRLAYGAVTADQVPAGIVDCSDSTTFDCSIGTLADAVAADKVLDAPTAVLGTLLATGTTLVADPGTLGDLLRAVMDFGNMSFDSVPLDALVQAAPTLFDRVATYTASADVTCDSGNGRFVVGIPAGFRLVPPRVVEVDVLDTAGPSSSAQAAPTFDTDELGRTLVPIPFSAPPCPEGGPLVSTVTRSFSALPGVVLGTHTASLQVEHDRGTTDPADDHIVATPHTAPYTVHESLEPNDGFGGGGDDVDVDTPTPIGPGRVVFSHIADGDDLDTYTLPGDLPRGSIVSAVLSHIPDGQDYDLLMDGPVAAPLRASPLRASPLRASPIEDNGFGGGAEPSDTLQDLPLRASPLRASDASGQTVEVVSTIIRNETGTARTPLSLQVAGYNGSHSAEPYTLQVLVQPPPDLDCGPVPRALGAGTGTPGPLPAATEVDGGTQSILLFNQAAFGQAYGADAAAEVLRRLQGLAARPEVAGVVLDPAADPGVAAAFDAWRNAPCEPEAANDVVRAINGLLDGYYAELPDLRFLTVVGDDDMIPFARVPDLVTLSNQVEYYTSAVFDGVDNPISAAYGYGYGLSDSAYTDLDSTPWLDHELLVPDLANGRIVETPEEIIGQIDAYEAPGGDHIDLGAPLVSGYDFLADAATSINGRLGGTDDGLINDSWTRADLAGGLGAGPTVASINAHFDHDDALPAIGDSSGSPSAELFSSADLADADLPAGALLFSVGCQSGLSVPDRAATTPGQTLDFAQVAAREAAGGYVANTGFGYGDTIAVAYSERIADLFAANLDGSMTVGQALVAARKAYLNELPLPGVYDEKALYEITPYGFPFIRVGADGVVAQGGGDVVGGPSPLATPTADIRFGMPSSPFAITPPLRSTTTPRGDHWLVDGHQPLLSHYQPAQPAMTVPLHGPPTGTVVGDALITGLSSRDVALPDPAFVRPTVDDAAREPELVSQDVAFPATLATITAGEQLALLPGQYRSDLGGVQRLYEEMEGVVLYPQAGSVADRPQITQVDVVDLGTSVAIRAEVDGAEQATVLYLPNATTASAEGAGDATDWLSLDLDESAPGVWTGTIAGVDVREVFVQAVRDGWVGTARGKGVDYLPEPPSTAPEGVDVAVTGHTITGEWYVGPATVTITPTGLHAGAGVEASAGGDGFGPVTGPFQLADDGIHVVDYRTSTGLAGRVVVPIDQAVPTVHILHPVDGAMYRPWQDTTPVLECGDVGSGLVNCQSTSEDAGTTLEPHRRILTATATDAAGNTATDSVTYHALPHQCGGQDVTILGSADKDVIRGTDGDDVIAGFGGDDVIDGNGGNDIICGGDDRDLVRGGDGDDTLFGGSGDIGDGNDVADGDDKLFGGKGDDTAHGDEGNDEVHGDQGDDRLFGGAGDDDLDGKEHVDTGDGGDGVDRCQRVEVATTCEA